ncbi:unnamed protein product [Adineta ricciae]|uniref:Glycosyl transferase family 25 domain-containing protein n=1 Tax=Adineta ricciae TaxID=249248 RepID=A0A814S065_ADIRI|nr:unnamed protein product [Adineta ricciae]CAF1186992.1 unnamed protein product [Adineta ricciae]
MVSRYTLRIFYLLIVVIILFKVFNLGLPNELESPISKDYSVYHHDSIAYDYYSKTELQQSKIGYQWNIWPLPNDINPNDISPAHPTNLSFVDVIYIMTNARLVERHEHLKKVFHRQGISMSSVQWRMKWNRTTCHSSLSQVYERLNLKNRALTHDQQRRCAITMEHVDTWYEIAKLNIRLALILEDDVIFVPYFKEKLLRMISTLFRTGALHFNKTCLTRKQKQIASNEWIDQNPMFVIGTCFQFHDEHFQKSSPYAFPLLSTQKFNASRCTHAYLLTPCSARALIEELQMQKNDFQNSDFLQNYLFRLSSTLQSFWMDPPLAYQGNQIHDYDHIKTFRSQTYLD